MTLRLVSKDCTYTYKCDKCGHTITISPPKSRPVACRNCKQDRASRLAEMRNAGKTYKEIARLEQISAGRVRDIIEDAVRTLLSKGDFDRGFRLMQKAKMKPCKFYVWAAARGIRNGASLDAVPIEYAPRLYRHIMRWRCHICNTIHRDPDFSYWTASKSIFLTMVGGEECSI